MFERGQGGRGPLARFAFSFFERENRSFEAIGGHWSPGLYTLAGEESAERVAGVLTTSGLLDVLGARPAAGRLFTERDAALGDASGIVISHRLWVRRYGTDPALVGRTVLVEGVSREVLGVMSPGTDLPLRKVDLWIPYAVPPGTPADDAFRIYVLARLRDGVDRSVAEADLARLTARFPEMGGFYSIYLDRYGLRTTVRPVREEVVGEVERPLWIVLGAVSVMLLVAVANVATLFLVRAEGRGREVAVRKALGAGRMRLVAHFVAESLCVALAAGAGGLVLAAMGVRLFASLAPPEIPRLDELSVGGATAGLVVVLSLAVAAGLGLYPFVRFGRGAAASPSARMAGESRRQASVGGGLVVLQVALALVLLSGSALLMQTFRHLRAVDPGFEPEGVLVAALSLPRPFYPRPNDVRQFRELLLERIEALPGVRRAAVGSSPLAVGGCNGLYAEGVVVPEGSFPPCVPVVLVSPGYWELLGIGLETGRTFDPTDLRGPAVAVVTADAARRIWPEGDALGGGVHPSPRRGPPWFPVIGITEPVRGGGPDEPPTEAVYLPVGSMDGEWGADRDLDVLVATTAREELDVVPALRSAVAEIDPGVPLTVRGSLEDELGRTMIRSTFTLFLLGTAAATALVLGLVGLYGVVSHRVESRRAEIGVRIAVGAGAAQVRNTVLAHSLRLVLAGTAIGLGAAAFLTRTLSSLLFGVRPGDPVLLGLAALALLAAAAAASWLPAHRATRIDPATTLRGD